MMLPPRPRSASGPAHDNRPPSLFFGAAFRPPKRSRPKQDSLSTDYASVGSTTLPTSPSSSCSLDDSFMSSPGMPPQQRERTTRQQQQQRQEELCGEKICVEVIPDIAPDDSVDERVTTRDGTVLKSILKTTNSSSCNESARIKKTVQYDMAATLTITIPIMDQDECAAVWYSTREMDLIRQHDQLLFKSQIILQAQDSNDCYQPVSTVKRYLLECKTLYESLQRQLMDLSSASSASFVSEDDWTHPAQVSCCTRLANHAVLRAGAKYYRGLESGRMAWRKARTKAIIRTIVRSPGNDKAALAQQMTRADRTWAASLAVNDERHLGSMDSDECIDEYEQYFSSFSEEEDGINNNNHNDSREESESVNLVSPRPNNFRSWFRGPAR